MKKDIKETWLRALRGNSPEGVYKQGIGYLSDKNGCFCALGVLVNETVGFTDTSRGNGRIRGMTTDLTTELAQKFDLLWPKRNIVMSMNDNEERTFDEIADWIETNL